MRPSRPERTATRLQITGTVGAVCVAIGAVIWATVFSPAFPFLPQKGNAEWIGPPDRITTDAVGVARANPRSVRFESQFFVEDTTLPVVVDLKAMRGFRIRLNGKEIRSRSAGEWNWKKGTHIDLGRPRIGNNRIEVEVVNLEGPPLLWLEGKTAGVEIATGRGWLVQEGAGGVQTARLANDTLRGAVGLTTPTLERVLAKHWIALIAIALVSALFSVVLRGLDAGRIHSWLTPTAWVFVGAFWLGLFVFTIAQLPAYHGYDGPYHLNYVRHLIEVGSLPLATDGFAMYHPPLFYLFSAGVWKLSGGPSAALHVLPFVSGLVQIGTAFALARLLFPGRREIAAIAVLVAGLIPVNVVLASHFSNEPFHSALSACVILVTAQLLMAESLSTRRCLLLGVLLGLVLLTKATGFLLLVLAIGFLGAKTWLTRTPGSGREGESGGVQTLALFLPICAIAGWFYIRNWFHLGQFVIGNWDVPGSTITWWQHPGFHTARYFIELGEGIQRPFYAGYASFADGLYATFWGDSLISGMSSFAVRHPFWNYEWMTLIPLLALPATALLMGGVAALGIQSFRGQNLRRRAVLSFIATTVAAYAFAVLFINIRLPFYAQAKASYALAVLAPIAVGGAYAIAEVRRHLNRPNRRWLLVFFDAWLGTLVVSIILSFGI